MTTSAFRPPTVEEAPASWESRLFLRVKLTRGVSVLEGPPGTYRTVRFPTQDELAAATAAYLGGHVYEVDADTRAALIAAGIGVTADNFSTPFSGFGAGGFGEGAFGT